MSRMEEMARKGRIVELREELAKAESKVYAVADLIGQEVNTLLGFDRLRGSVILASAETLRDLLDQRQIILAEIKRLGEM
jgi:hypothetical protein